MNHPELANLIRSAAPEVEALPTLLWSDCEPHGWFPPRAAGVAVCHLNIIAFNRQAFDPGTEHPTPLEAMHVRGMPHVLLHELTHLVDPSQVDRSAHRPVFHAALQVALHRAFWAGLLPCVETSDKCIPHLELPPLTNAERVERDTPDQDRPRLTAAEFREDLDYATGNGLLAFSLFTDATGANIPLADVLRFLDTPPTGSTVPEIGQTIPGPWGREWTVAEVLNGPEYDLPLVDLRAEGPAGRCTVPLAWIADAPKAEPEGNP